MVVFLTFVEAAADDGVGLGAAGDGVGLGVGGFTTGAGVGVGLETGDGLTAAAGVVLGAGVETGVGFGGATIDDDAMGAAFATELRVTSCVYAFSPSFSIWTATPISR